MVVPVYLKTTIFKIFGMWRSSEAHSLWERRVGGSSPLIPTKIEEFTLNYWHWIRFKIWFARKLSKILNRPIFITVRGHRTKVR